MKIGQAGLLLGVWQLVLSVAGHSIENFGANPDGANCSEYSSKAAAVRVTEVDKAFAASELRKGKTVCNGRICQS